VVDSCGNRKQFQRLSEERKTEEGGEDDREESEEVGVRFWEKAGAMIFSPGMRPGTGEERMFGVMRNC
jgi:hypothetical protein